MEAQAYKARCTIYCSRNDCQLLETSSGPDRFTRLYCRICGTQLELIKQGNADLILAPYPWGEPKR
jgi:hypothetical protein